MPLVVQHAFVVTALKPDNLFDLADTALSPYQTIEAQRSMQLEPEETLQKNPEPVRYDQFYKPDMLAAMRASDYTFKP